MQQNFYTPSTGDPAFGNLQKGRFSVTFVLGDIYESDNFLVNENPQKTNLGQYAHAPMTSQFTPMPNCQCSLSVKLVRRNEQVAYRLRLRHDDLLVQSKRDRQKNHEFSPSPPRRPNSDRLKLDSTTEQLILQKLIQHHFSIRCIGTGLLPKKLGCKREVA